MGTGTDRGGGDRVAVLKWIITVASLEGVILGKKCVKMTMERKSIPQREKELQSP